MGLQDRTHAVSLCLLSTTQQIGKSLYTSEPPSLAILQPLQDTQQVYKLSQTGGAIYETTSIHQDGITKEARNISIDITRACAPDVQLYLLTNNSCTSSIAQ